MDTIVYEVWDYGMDGRGKPVLQLATTNKQEALDFDKAKGAWSSPESIRAVVKDSEELLRALKTINPYLALAIYLDTGMDYKRKPRKG